MDKSDLLFTPAVELARLINRREVSPVEVVKDVLARIEALQPAINAFITVRAEAALEEARQAEARAIEGCPAGPLDGVPFSAKDLLWTKDVRTTFGSVIFADFIPSQDAPSVARLRDAGAILIGKTTTPEFGHKAVTDGPLFGVTRNPWRLDRSSGGSSGGAGAAVAAGLGPIALGTDGGGSIRIPASCTGVVGFKPTLGRVPHPQAPDVFGNLSYVGPMTRTVADAALALEIISGPHPEDPHSMVRPKEKFLSILEGNPAEAVKGLKVAWTPRLGNLEVDVETLGFCRRMVDKLAGLGAEVEVVAPDFQPQEEVFLVFLQSGLAARLGQYLDQYRDRLDQSLVMALTRGFELTAVRLQEAIQVRTRLYQAVQRFFGKYDLLVSPTLSRPALSADQRAWDPVEVNGRSAGSLRSAWYPYTHPFNMSGHPAVSIPCGWTAEGLPVGFQIVGRLWQDGTVLETAAALESLCPWADRRPGIMAAPDA
ncbi:MAG: amidase family protein [Thermodesulfobacteriota bacterium]